MPRRDLDTNDTTTTNGTTTTNDGTTPRQRNPIGPAMNGADFLRIVRLVERPYFAQNVLAANPTFAEHHYTPDEVRNILDALIVLSSIDADSDDARSMVLDAATQAMNDAASRPHDPDEVDEIRAKREAWLKDQPAFIDRLTKWFSRFNGQREKSALAFTVRGAILCCEQRLR